MIARTFIAQRTVNHDEIRRSLQRSDLAGSGDADQKTATGREKLLGDEDGKCGPYRTPYNAVVVLVVAEGVRSVW